MIPEVTPKRWHIYVVDLEPRVGTKPGKQRPCISIQPSEFAEAGLKSSVVIPLTTRVVSQEAFPLRVRLPKGTCGLTLESDALVDQLLAWDHTLFRRDLGPLPEALVDQLKLAIREFLDL